MKRLTIWHPYGTIAPLDTDEHNGIAFGQNEYVNGRCFELASRIKTFTEEHEDRPMIEQIRATIRKAETVVFLGFGYYSQNLQLIEPDGATQVDWILGTAYGASPSDKAMVEVRLTNWDKGDPPSIDFSRL